MKMNIEELAKQIEQIRLQLVHAIMENGLNLQHARILEVSQHLDDLIVQYHSKTNLVVTEFQLT
jgi:hypothetical protein